MRSTAATAAEPPSARLSALGDRGAETLLLQGTKAWCSGAASVTRALVTAWNEWNEPVLAAVDLGHPGVRVTDSGWHAVGMQASASVDVRFEQVLARPIGPPRAYLERPGFWQGGAGIAACWFGAAAGIAEFVARGLREAGFVVDGAADGEEGLRMALERQPDVAIVDLMLPKLDGLGVIEALRRRGRSTPVLILSARRTVDDRVRGLQAGGDDYLTKPFAFAELLARVQALVRRATRSPEPTTLTVGDLTLDLLSRKSRAREHQSSCARASSRCSST